MVLLFLKITKIYLLLKAKIQKHQAFEAEVSAHANAIQALDEIGNEMISQGHFASEIIRVRNCVFVLCNFKK